MKQQKKLSLKNLNVITISNLTVQDAALIYGGAATVADTCLCQSGHCEGDPGGLGDGLG